MIHVSVSLGVLANFLDIFVGQSIACPVEIKPRVFSSLISRDSFEEARTLEKSRWLRRRLYLYLLYKLVDI